MMSFRNRASLRMFNVFTLLTIISLVHAYQLSSNFSRETKQDVDSRRRISSSAEGVSADARTGSIIEQIAPSTSSRCSTELHAQWNAAVSFRYKTAFKVAGDCFPREYFLKDTARHGPSGPGSSLQSTEPARGLITRLLGDDSLQIRTFFDAPCGDWVWMQLVDLSNVSYVGADITTVTVQQNTRCFSRPNVQFAFFDLTCMTPPPVDLMMVRDVLFHMTDDLVLKVLRNIAASKVRYFLSTSFLGQSNAKSSWDAKSAYQDTHSARTAAGKSLIGYRDINLMDAPFCLPAPIFRVRENVYKRFMAVWSLPFSVGDCA